VKKTILILGLMLFCSSAQAQNVPVFKNYQTRWLFDSELGSERLLGFKEPHVAVGSSFEQPLGKHFEIQGKFSYSPDDKINNGGDSISTDGLAIGWLTNRVGILGKVHHTQLWTPQFNKHATSPAVGAVLRVHEFGLAGRLYLDYVLPTGCTRCRIQGSRLQGIEGYQDLRYFSHFRIGIKISFFTFLEQGNPLSDAPRKRDVALTYALVLRFAPRSEDITRLY
jgi:hypothetical protein